MMNNKKFSLREEITKKRTLASFIISFLILYFIFSRINIAETFSLIKTADISLLFLGFFVYYASFTIRGLRWQILLKNTGFKRNAKDLTEILFISWFVNCLVPAKLGDIYRGYLIKKNYRVSGSNAIGTIFVERIFDIIVLVIVLTITSLLIFGERIPNDVSFALTIGLLLCVVLIIGIFVMIHRREYIKKTLPARTEGFFIRFEEGLSSSLTKKTFPLIALYTLLCWAFEIGRLFFVVYALNLNVSIEVIAFVALAASLLTAIPITPAGLGVVEVSIIGILMMIDIPGMNYNIAASVALLDRFISYYSLVIIGGITFLLSKKR